MFSGHLPASDETLNLIANPLALDIHASSSNLSVTYEGDCSCALDPYESQYACRCVMQHGP